MKSAENPSQAKSNVLKILLQIVEAEILSRRRVEKHWGDGGHRCYHANERDRANMNDSLMSACQKIWLYMVRI
jgi:hypothetical protein